MQYTERWRQSAALVVFAALGVTALTSGLSHAAPAIVEPVIGLNAPIVSRLSPATRLSTSAAESHRVVGYVTSWGIYERDFQIADIAADEMTHLNYAFANVHLGKCVLGDPWADVQRPLPSDDLSLPYRGNFNQLNVLKAKHPTLRTLLSIGGSTWSAGFSDAAATASSRRTFAASCVELMERYGFDGLDIDWEYPTHRTGDAGERADFTALVSEFRRQIDVVAAATAQERLLTIAAPAGPTTMTGFDIPAIMPSLDWVNVMTYDFAGPWSPRTGHNAPLFTYPGIEDPTFTVDSGMRRWVAAGASPDKLNLGLAFYGRGFGGVGSAQAGASFSSLPMGTTEPGQFDYAQLSTSTLSGMTVTFDAAARVPFAYDSSSQVWISFDNEISIAEKAQHATRQNHGGVVIWELSNDADGALLDAVRRGLSS